MRISAVVGATALAFTLTACGQSTEEPTDGGMKDSMPSSAMTDHMSDDSMGAMSEERKGTFEGLNGKKVAGMVKVADGKVILSGFSSDEGPDLHLYLAKGSDEADVMAGKSLGKVSYDTASQSFELSGVDPDGYDTVVVHCDKAKAVFGAAELSS
jgi:hypothetical protein